MTKTILISLEPEDFKRLISESTKSALMEYDSISKESKQEASNELLKIEQVAKYLCVSKVTIHEWKKKGIIPFHRMGRRVFFKKHEILEALKKASIRK